VLYGLRGCMSDEFDSGLVAEIDYLWQYVHHARCASTYDERFAIPVQERADISQRETMSLPPEPVCLNTFGMAAHVVQI